MTLVIQKKSVQIIKGPLFMSPVDQAGLLILGPILPWVHMGTSLAQNSRNQSKVVKHKIITFQPIIALATLRAEQDAYDVENTV